MVWGIILIRSAIPDKSRIVEEGNYHKFTKSKKEEGMLRKLLDTGNRELVEVSVRLPARERPD